MFENRSKVLELNTVGFVHIGKDFPRFYAILYKGRFSFFIVCKGYHRYRDWNQDVYVLEKGEEITGFIFTPSEKIDNVSTYANIADAFKRALSDCIFLNAAFFDQGVEKSVRIELENKYGNQTVHLQSR